MMRSRLLLLLLPTAFLLLSGCAQEQSLAYLDDGEVYLWNQDMSQGAPLTDRNDVDQFFWSPSGRHLAYQVSKPYGDSFWCYADIDSGAEVKTRSQPLFSAAGRMVAYIRERDNQLILLKEDGGGQTIIAEGVWSAEWNPEGTRLAFVEEGDLKVFELDGMVSRYLAGEVASAPDFVADDLILYMNEDNTLMASPVDGDRAYRLVEEARSYFIPRNTNGVVQGTRLICVDRDRDAYLMDFDGADQRRTGTDTYRVVWNPSGSRFFLIEHRDENYQVTLYGADGEILLKIKEPWEAVSANTLAWGSGDAELAYLDEEARLYTINLTGQEQLVAREVLDFAWVPFKRELLALQSSEEPLETPEVTPETEPTEESAEGEEEIVEGELADGETEGEGENNGEEAVAEDDSATTEVATEENPAAEETTEEIETAPEETEPVVAAPTVTERTEPTQPLPDGIIDIKPADESPFLITTKKGFKLVKFPPEVKELEPAEITELEPAEELTDQPEATLATVYLYDLTGKPRRRLSRGASLPRVSPDGKELLFMEPLEAGLFKAVILLLGEDKELYLGKFDNLDLPMSWQQRGLTRGGDFSQVIFVLLLIGGGISLLVFLIRLYLRHREKEEKLAPPPLTDDDLM